MEVRTTRNRAKDAVIEGYPDMDEVEKIDCGANGKIVLGQLTPLHLQILKNVLTNGSQCKECQREE
jgi:hypothetical protein